MRKVRRIVLHCTSGWPLQSTASIKDHWKNNLGWSQVGYHILIHADGTIEHLAKLSEVTNGVGGYNSDSVHICYVGGLKEITKAGKYIYGDTRTQAQIDSFYSAIEWVYKELSKTQQIDDIPIVGHRDLSKDLNKNGKVEEREWVKVCPTFDVIEEFGWMSGNKGLNRLKDRATY